MKRIALIVTFLLAPALSIAGEHQTLTDDFTGEVTKIFATTQEEALSNKAIYVLRDYKPAKNTINLIVKSNAGSTACDERYLLLKDSEGTIHEIDAVENGTDTCIALNLDANLVKKTFQLRIPLYRGSNLDISADTSSLDLKKL